MLTNITVKGNENYLIDNQSFDPKANPNLPSDADGALWKPFTIIEADGSQRDDLYIPMILIIDLKREHTLTDIYYYLNNGSTGNKVQFFAGNPTTWETTPFAELEAIGYQSWVKKTLSTTKTTRFLKVQVNSVGIGMRELILYGSTNQTAVVDPLPTGTIPTRPKMWDFAGSNLIGNEFDTDIYSVSGTHRSYSDLQYLDKDLVNSYPNNTFSFGEGNYDTFLKHWKDNNIHQFWAVQGNTKRFINANPSEPNASNIKPLATGADPESPASYVEHGDAMFQIAARYGKVAVASTRLRLAAGITVASGLGYMNSVENGNENNKYWKGRKGYYNPYEYAAMSSADYDGHENTLGPNIGIKNADPDFKLINAAIVSLDTSYVKAMAHWCQYKRTDKKMIWDVINIHHYSNDGGGQTGQATTTGVSPEQDGLYTRLKTFMDFKNKYWPEKEVYWSEFGYDLSPTSAQKTPTVSGQTLYLTQANLVIRSFLIGAAAGLDRMQQYMMRHSNFSETETGLYNTSGLVNKGNDYENNTHITRNPIPYPCWYAIYTMRNTLKDYRFSQIINSGNANVVVYKFINDNNQIAYALWCPTVNNTMVSNYSLNIGNNYAQHITFENNNRNGAIANLNTINGNITLNITESPSYVIIGGTLDAKDFEKPRLFSFAPNPAESEINLFFKKDAYSIQITDLQGKKVLTKEIENQSETTINVNQLSTGVYLLKVKNKSGEQSVMKMIKK